MKKILFALFLISGVTGTSAQDRPNIVYILCDDLGYGDVHVLNPDRGKIPTPNIDRLASEGMTFTDAHSGSSVCTPSRYGILTGRYSWRSRLQDGVLNAGREFEPLIDEKRMTVAGLMKQAGYATAAMGKWHLGFRYVDDRGERYDLYQGGKLTNAPIGSTIPDGPVTRGFDYFIGFHHSAAMESLIENDKVVAHRQPVEMLQLLAKSAKEYITTQSAKSQPFFLYLALNSPHSPVVPSEKWRGKSGMGSYADFVMETDDVVGQVLDVLKANDLEHNTLVFFTSDNGCSYPVARGHVLEKEYGHYASANLRGSKADIWDGGHRIPFIVRWTGRIEPNSQNDALICQTSLMATCAEILGVRLPDNAGEDSYSILPMLLNKRHKSPYKYVVHHSIHGKFSIRDQKWKLELTPGSGGWTKPTDVEARQQGLPDIQLYDMEQDEEESNNVYAKYPSVVKKLTRVLEEVVENGRSTPGERQANDVVVDIYKAGR